MNRFYGINILFYGRNIDESLQRFSELWEQYKANEESVFAVRQKIFEQLISAYANVGAGINDVSFIHAPHTVNTKRSICDLKNFNFWT